MPYSLALFSLLCLRAAFILDR